MEQKISQEEIKEEELEAQEPVKFGYTASVIFLIFIGFIVYTSIR